MVIYGMIIVIRTVIILIIMVVWRQPGSTWLFFHVFPLDASLGRHTLKSIWGSSTWSRGADYLDMKVAVNIIVQ